MFKLLSALEKKIRAGAANACLNLSPEMERDFQAQMDTQRTRRVRATGMLAMVIYGSFGISDRMVLPDAYVQAWMIRFLLVIPLMMLATFAVPRIKSLVMREVLMAMMITVAAASIVWIAGLSINGTPYHSGITVVLLFGTIVVGLRFRSAIISSMIVMLTYGTALVVLPEIEFSVRFNNWLLFAASAVIGLVANFRMEQDQRRAFLANAREQQRNEELNAAVTLLEKLSSEDSLTKVANRREFDRRLRAEWGRLRRNGQPLALISLDVDSFKAYNDHYGHPAGDACLQQIAAALRAYLKRSSDLVARVGGEEFALLLPNTSANEAAQLAEHLRRTLLDLQLPHAFSSVAQVVSASFGVVAMVPTADNDPSVLLATADAALYTAKRQGRNRVVVRDIDPACALPAA